MGAAGRSLAEASTLVVQVSAQGLPPLTLVHHGVPSLAAIDDESAEEFTRSVLASLSIEFVDGEYQLRIGQT